MLGYPLFVLFFLWLSRAFSEFGRASSSVVADRRKKNIFDQELRNTIQEAFTGCRNRQCSKSSFRTLLFLFISLRSFLLCHSNLFFGYLHFCLFNLLLLLVNLAPQFNPCMLGFSLCFLVLTTALHNIK